MSQTKRRPKTLGDLQKEGVFDDPAKMREWGLDPDLMAHLKQIHDETIKEIVFPLSLMVERMWLRGQTFNAEGIVEMRKQFEDQLHKVLDLAMKF